MIGIMIDHLDSNFTKYYFNSSNYHEELFSQIVGADGQ